jgi:hypothetical protein
VRGRRAVLITVLAVLCVPAVTVVMILAHEIGHTVMARLLGDGRAAFRLWGHGHAEFDAATSFGSQATGWSHPSVAAVDFAAAALYTVVLAVAVHWTRPRSITPPKAPTVGHRAAPRCCPAA